LPAIGSPGIDADAALDRARFSRRLDGSWRRTSYTALTAAAHDALVASEPEDAGVTDEPEGPGVTAASELPLSVMASGPRLGTLIHETLQVIEFDVPELTAVLRVELEQATVYRPELLGCPPELAAVGLAQALATPLGGELGGLALTMVSRQDRLDELGFELPLAGGDQPVSAAQLADIGALLTEFTSDDDPIAGYAQRLSDPVLASVLRGYLTGSIDLVLRVQGAGGRARYAVIDYKTNWLAPAGEELSAASYRPSALAREMQRSHYVLQGLLYAVALHRYLRWRAPDYDPATDLAGVHYLFLRGMLGPDEVEPTGVFAWRPSGELVVALSDLLAGGTSR
jgi:exodeoxyribonuclease V beta subunit